MLTPIERLDDNPTYTVKNVESGRLYAVAQERLTVPARNVEPYTTELLLRDAQFVHPKNASKRWLGAPARRLVAGQGLFVRNSDTAFRAVVVSRNVNVAHAIRVDLGDPEKFESVSFHITNLPKAMWTYAEYSAVICHEGLNYATIAPFWPSTLGFTFGRQYQKGGFRIVDVKNKQIQDMFGQSPVMLRRFVDGA